MVRVPCNNALGHRFIDPYKDKQDQGLVMSTKILRSEKFPEKVRKFQTHHSCKKGPKSYLASNLAWLAH